MLMFSYINRGIYTCVELVYSFWLVGRVCTKLTFKTPVEVYELRSAVYPSSRRISVRHRCAIPTTESGAAILATPLAVVACTVIRQGTLREV